ncbi:MAG: ankyrin repeat domain-containing protein [Cyanobacteria bacterium P01_E01_bin.6]
MSLEDGLIAFKRGRYAEAIAHLDAYCTESQASGKTGSRNYMQAGMSLVKAYHAEKQFEQAIAQCKAFMTSDKNPALQIWADKTFPKLQQAQSKPETDAKTSSEPTPTAESPESIQLLDAGIAAQKQGDNEAAIEFLDSYLSCCCKVRSRNYMQAHISRVKAYRSLGQADRAYSICQELQAIDNPALQSWASKAMTALRPSGTSSAEQTDSPRTDSPRTDSPRADAASSSPAESEHVMPTTSATRSPAPVPRKPPIRPGVAQLLDNTSTIEISAVAGAAATITSGQATSESATPLISSEGDRSSTATRSATANRQIQSAKERSPRSAQGRSSQPRTSNTKGTGAAALLGGGVLVLLTRPIFRRSMFTLIAFAIGLSRACLGGDFTSNDSYADESYLDYSSDALHDAACIGDPQEAQVLLENGTSADVLDTDGNTPLFLSVSGCSSAGDVYSVTEGHRAVTTLLISNGASSTIVNDYGETPLHWAAAYGTADITMSLVSQGASVSAVDSHQDTPLHWAAWAGNQESVETLVNLGVPLSPQNADGETPLDLARYYHDHASVAMFLQSRGAVAATKN